MAYIAGKRFEWDDSKNRANRARHGFSFENAVDLFTSGSDYLEIYDAEHFVTEDRFIAVGMVRGEIVAVVVTEPGEHVTRIVSARRATRREAQLFWTTIGGSDGC